MSIFGEKCDRCGDRTRHKQDDKPICKHCESEMAILVEAGKESKRCCPVDGAEMEKAIAHMMVIDRCPTCKGVWLDGGELVNIYSSASNEAIIAMGHGLSFPMG